MKKIKNPIFGIYNAYINSVNAYNKARDIIKIRDEEILKLKDSLFSLEEENRKLRKSIMSDLFNKDRINIIREECQTIDCPRCNYKY